MSLNFVVRRLVLHIAVALLRPGWEWWREGRPLALSPHGLRPYYPCFQSWVYTETNC
jgi:hypothetical protein